MNIIHFVLNVLIVGIIFYWSTKIYKKQQVKPAIWKIILTLLVSLFSFSLNLQFFDTIFKFAILPLGVWILYVCLKGKDGRWNNYRPYAWLGFGANYFFLLTTLLTMVISLFIYPKDSINTYISTISEGQLIAIHPSAEENFTLVENAKEQLAHFKYATFYEIDWYYESYSDIKGKNYEQFPYLLANTKSSWGSGLDVTVYIEQDGKGLLIKKGEETIYFRSDQSLLVEGD